MKKNYFLLLLLTLSVMANGVILSSFVAQNASAVGTVNSSVKAGDNYWYNVTAFTPLQNIVDNVVHEALSSNNQSSLPNGVNYTFTGGLKDSMIYVKVVDVNQEVMTYFDGSSKVTGTLPTVDIATGLITGQAMSGTVNYLDNNSQQQTLSLSLPKGLGLPIPAIFGTSTVFNVTTSPMGLLPLPVILNNDWAMHETILNQLKASAPNPSAVSVVSDSSKLSISANGIPVNQQGDMVATFGFSWRKSDGALNTVNFEITNSTDSTTFINIAISLTSKENKILAVNVGDSFTVGVTDAGFQYSLSGFNPTDQSSISNQLNAVQANMSKVVGKNLINFKVTKIDGLWYQVQGQVYDTNKQVYYDVPGPNDQNLQYWMYGFGRLGFGMPMNFGQMFGPVNPADPWTPASRRGFDLPGIVVTQDWKIYQAWDLTEATFIGTESQLLVKIMKLAEATQPSTADPHINFGSSTTNTPVLSATLSSALTATQYTIKTTVNWDIRITGNSTQYDINNLPTGWMINDILTTGNIVGNEVYDQYGTFNGYSITGQFTVSNHQYNSTKDYGTQKITISNIKIDISTNYVANGPRQGSGGSSSITPGGFLGPDFSVFVVITTFAFSALVFFKKKKYTK